MAAPLAFTAVTAVGRLRYVLIVLLSVTAALLGLLTMHSMAGHHEINLVEGSSAPGVAAAENHLHGATALSDTVPAFMSSVVGVELAVGAVLMACENCALDGALVDLACVLILLIIAIACVVGSLRMHLVLDTLGWLRCHSPPIAVRSARPSLLVLCISRT